MDTIAKVPPKQRLTAERTRRRWTQLEVADQLGTTPGNVSRWERGITSPGPYFRSKLGELFGMSAHDLGLTWDASEDLLAQRQTLVGPSTTGALTQIQTNNGRGCTGKAAQRQTAIEFASRYHGGSLAVLWVKASTREVEDEGLTMLTGGLDRPEQRQEQLVQAVMHRLHINPDWVLVLDNVEEVMLVVDVLPSGIHSTVTTIDCTNEMKRCHPIRNGRSNDGKAS